MNQARLIRFGSIPGMGTFGRLYVAEFSCFTVEREWMGNEPYISCIPAGEYALRPSLFHRWTPPLPTWEIMEVPGRTHIKLHPANRAEQLQGCVGPGDSLGVTRGKWSVMNSRATFDTLASALRSNPLIEISIQWQDATCFCPH